MNTRPLKLNQEFKEILNEIELSQESYFITGKAGTGKSTLLRLMQRTTRKRLVTLAPTGVAALQVNGQTIHSFFGFPPRLYSGETIERRRNRKIFNHLDTIVIDEISMVRADLMDQIDQFLKVQRDSNLPFGGIQMIFFGDLFQLPPVVTNELRPYFNEIYETPYFFSAHAINREFILHGIELTEVFRQTDRFFIRILDEIRTNQVDWDTLEALNEQIRPDSEPEPMTITLASRNSIVEQINSSRLNKINAPTRMFAPILTGEFPQRKNVQTSILELKEGAQVMCLRNDPQLRYVNGTIGIFTRMDGTDMYIEINDPIEGTKEVKVQRAKWDMIKYRWENDKIESKIVGSIEQYPIRLAWAVTIHKSQGQTFDKVFLEMGKGAFEFGQTYVALSRCRTLEGITLKRALRMKDIIVDERIVDFYQRSF